jgi:NADH:ubiquinone oxidoreductase subunit 6 (subunit J)
MLVADYPFLQVFWTILVFFGWVIWITVLMMVLYDNFRRHDHSGWAKAGWTVFVIFLPVIGVLVYIVTRSHEAAEAARGAPAEVSQP